MRTGFGFDSHLFGLKGTLVLGGVHIKGMPALAGHSDGDALVHAVIDALLGAASLGDIGEMFPDTSKKTKGLSSLVMLTKALKKARLSHWVPVHVDVTVVAEKPKLFFFKKKIGELLAKYMNLPVSAINIKAKTPEGLTWFRSPGGIAVWAVVNCERV